ncbi:hypothetical protein GGR52DRAFT_175470 [Hypoxylon sp. FL1284]|nr:hypothetical protein GGR52DRAFT_175470 [Hypoxylon sp. FL1284]
MLPKRIDMSLWSGLTGPAVDSTYRWLRLGDDRPSRPDRRDLRMRTSEFGIVRRTYALGCVSPGRELGTNGERHHRLLYDRTTAVKLLWLSSILSLLGLLGSRRAPRTARRLGSNMSDDEAMALFLIHSIRHKSDERVLLSWPRPGPQRGMIRCK